MDGNFFDIGQLTDEFEQVRQEVDGEDFENRDFEFLKLKVNLAIAQQLAVISSRLKALKK